MLQSSEICLRQSVSPLLQVSVQSSKLYLCMSVIAVKQVMRRNLQLKHQVAKNKKTLKHFAWAAQHIKEKNEVQPMCSRNIIE